MQILVIAAELFVVTAFWRGVSVEQQLDSAVDPEHVHSEMKWYLHAPAGT